MPRKCRYSATTQGMYDLDPVAIVQGMLGVAAAGHDLAVHLHRHPALGQALEGQQAGDGEPVLGQGEGLAVELKAHVRIFAGCGPAAQRLASKPCRSAKFAKKVLNRT
jgi:hypothetical protein